MKEHPIIFSAPMVRAILGGRKTQTRRVIRPQPNVGPSVVQVRLEPHPFSPSLLANTPAEGLIGGRDRLAWVAYDWIDNPIGIEEINWLSSFYQPGDRLWVREGWRIGAWDEDTGRVAIDYRADGYCRREWLEIAGDDSGDIFNRLWIQSTDDAEKALGVQEFYHWEPGKSPCRWRPSIFMPRWAARILLEVASIRAERLQDISASDCLAEGMDGLTTLFSNSDEPCDDRGISVHEQFFELWDSLNARRGHDWHSNPWVQVIEFKII